MFTDFFELHAMPFVESLNLDRMLRDQRMAEGLARLQCFTQSGLIALVSGPTGVGKSSLVEMFVQDLPAHHIHPLRLSLSAVDAVAVLRQLVVLLGERPFLGKDRLFHQVLHKLQQMERTCLLIVDEAHLLSEQALVALRLLVSAPGGQAQPLKLLLCGQEPIEQLLARSSLADLLNRIHVRYRLRPFSRDQSVCYIDHCLTKAGARPELFDLDAKHRIHDFGHGIPREINSLATVCLIHAAGKHAKRIDEPLVQQAAAELRIL
jgi:general secretion pathway protein A